MKRAIFALFAVILFAAAAPASAPALAPRGRLSLGQFGRWGAFRDTVPRRCYAISEPVRGKGSFAVSTWPDRGRRFQIDVWTDGAGSGPLVMRFGNTSLALTTADGSLQPTGPRAAERVIQAMRQGRIITIAAARRGGHGLATYSTAGAPSAIDAALIGCLPQGNVRNAGKARQASLLGKP